MSKPLPDVLNGVEIGMWADQVLEKLPRPLMVRKLEVYKEKEATAVDDQALIVKWFYPGVTLTLEYATYKNIVLGTTGSVYAVQNIEENDYVNPKFDHKLRRSS